VSVIYPDKMLTIVYQLAVAYRSKAAISKQEELTEFSGLCCRCFLKKYIEIKI